MIIAAGRTGVGIRCRVSSYSICGGEHSENLIQCRDTHDIIPCTKNDGTTWRLREAHLQENATSASTPVAYAESKLGVRKSCYEAILDIS
jgi:hypothetical protein